MTLTRRIMCLPIIAATLLASSTNSHAENAADYVARAKERLRKCEDDNALGDRERAIAHCDAALADCDKALAINAKDVQAYGTRARAWVLRNDYDKAIAECDKAIAIDSKFAEAYANRGDAWLQKNDLDKALADCNKALAMDPKLAGAYFTRASVSWRKGESDEAIADFKRALVVTPDDWKVLNNLGVLNWILAQDQVSKAMAAEAAGDAETAKICRQESVALKEEAKAHWNRGAAANPRSADIHSNLGYAYSEANDLDSAERHLTEAVRLKPISPRPHNNLGRVLLRRSQQYEDQAHQAEAKDKTDSRKVQQLRDDARTKLEAAIAQFERAVELDPTLLEARLNLGEVFTRLNDLDKAKVNYKAILQYAELLDREPAKVKDWDVLANFSQAHFGMARIALAREDPAKAIKDLRKAIEMNPRNLMALQFLTVQRYERREYGEGEKCLAAWLTKLPPAARQQVAAQFAKQLDDAGHHEAAEKAREAAKSVVKSSPK